MDRLIREGNPPVGQLASPVPQYKRPGSTDYETVEGQHGAPFAILKDASGVVISPATEDKLEQVRQLLSGVATEAKLEQARVLLNAISNKDFATQATLEVVQSELALIKSELDNIKQNQTSGDQKVQLKGQIASSVGRMAVRTSEPVKLDIPTYDGGGQPVHPSVVYIPHGFGPGGYPYWMAFTPFTNADPQTENPSVVASYDGINWEVPPGLTNPIVGPPPSGFYADPSLVYDGSNNVLELWYNGPDSSVYRSQSSNGVTWSTPVVVHQGSWSERILLTRGRVRQMFIKSSREAMGRRISLDEGNTWTAPMEVLSNWNGAILHYTAQQLGAGGLHFLIAGSDTYGYTRQSNLYYGYSVEGGYVHVDEIPLLAPNPESDWYNARIYTSCMAPMGDGQIGVWFSAHNRNNQYGIGHFTIDVATPPADAPVNIPLFYLEEIRDTELHWSPFWPSSGYHRYPRELLRNRNRALVIQNYLGVQVDLRAWSIYTGGTVGARGIESPTSAVPYEITIPPQQAVRQILGPRDWPFLGDVWPTQMVFSVTAKSVPTNGNFSMHLVTT